MTEQNTAKCRYCLQPFAIGARVCHHCRSHQGWVSNAQDPRYLLVALVPILVAMFAFVAFMELVVVPKRKGAKALEPTCRGLVVAVDQAYNVKAQRDADMLYLRILVKNTSQTPISDPVVRVDAFDSSGTLVDTSHRTAYGADVPSGGSSWFRVQDTISVDPSTIASVKGSIMSADCRPAW